MTTRHELSLEEKINLLKERERGLSYLNLGDKFNLSIGAVSNILKRKYEYTNDYETNQNKKVKRKFKDDISQRINEEVYEWFVAQRSKNIAISGPILQEYARKVAVQLDNSSDQFKASNGWLDRFRTRYNIQFRVISGEYRSVDPNTVDDWIIRLSTIIAHYDPANVFNCDETGLFYKLMPDRSLVINKNDCKGGKKSKERYTVMLCANWAGTEKLKPVVIGKAAKPRCFKNIDMSKLPVSWNSNRTAWMNSRIFTEWLLELDAKMQRQKRHILLFLDNAPVHPSDVQLENIKLKFFPANTTAKIQPMDQGIIRAFKAHYRRYLVKHIIASASVAHTADDVNITALDAVYWIDAAWEAVTEEAIQNTFRSAGFERSFASNELNASDTAKITGDSVIIGEKLIEELDKVLKHLTIVGKTMCAKDYVGIDDEIPSFNEWDDPVERILCVNGICRDEIDNSEDLPTEEPPSLSESLEMVRRLRLLSNTQQPELHQFIVQLQSKLTDVFLDSNYSKQRQILDYFKPVSEIPGRDFGT